MLTWVYKLYICVTGITFIFFAFRFKPHFWLSSAISSVGCMIFVRHSACAQVSSAYSASVGSPTSFCARFFTPPSDYLSHDVVQNDVEQGRRNPVHKSNTSHILPSIFTLIDTVWHNALSNFTIFSLTPYLLRLCCVYNLKLYDIQHWLIYSVAVGEQFGELCTWLLQ